MNIDSRVEAILFAVAQALSLKKLAMICDCEEQTIELALDNLAYRLNKIGSGIRLLRHEDQVELVTHPDAADDVRRALKEDVQSELTRPSLETLAILAYRGSLTRPELEQIRGVQSSLILRNLIMRGLVEECAESRVGQSVYRVTIDFLKLLGVDCVESLPHFDEWRNHPAVEQIIGAIEQTSASKNISL